MELIKHYPHSYFLRAIMRIGDVYNDRAEKIDFGTKSGFLREITEFSGLGEFSGLIDRVIRLHELGLVKDDEVNEVIDSWEKLWYKVLGFKSK